MSMQIVRTPKEVREWLERHGITACEWAQSHGFDAAVVYSLLNGRTRGRRGHAHQAAIALGLKTRPLEGEEPPLKTVNVARSSQ